MTLVAICLLGSTAFGGIRGPGPYSGIVVYDQWDTCYIYSGAYLMYIAEKEKERLRKYSGQSILIDATEVDQPENPGDGLITKFKVVGPAEVKDNLPRIEGLKLTLRRTSDNGRYVRFDLLIENQSNKTIVVNTDDIAPTLLGEKGDDDIFSPSDGKSDAKITRTNLQEANSFLNETTLTSKDLHGKPVKVTRKYSVQVDDIETLPKSLALAAGVRHDIFVSLDLPNGKYDFLFGYGGGVHEGRGLASNLIPFSVDMPLSVLFPYLHSPTWSLWQNS